MKKPYLTPAMERICFGEEDVLRTSDNDAGFVPPENSEDHGWSGYH